MISILGDEEKRALYDQTGCVEDAVSALYIYIYILQLLNKLLNAKLLPKFHRTVTFDVL